ncbi:type 1 fimbrial protein [Salmonella enterica]|nr:type 1 fimbrial protein [Salmonella enterica]EJH7440649.1 type 1 fimbrial protein [Salmonella enterica]EJH7880024.1 type 1 fimbrial protein [Salmonella enterica]EJI6712773.1 type 1 fimbrial protein [Salmonella enterica]
MIRRPLFSILLLGATMTFAHADTNTGSVTVSGNLLASACTLTSGSELDFNLEQVSRSDLPDVGSTFGRLEQDIELSCDEGTLVYMTVNGDTESDDNTIIKNAGDAGGVGLQLLDVTDNNTPVEIGTRWMLVNGAKATETIPLAAQYIRTGELSSGTVEASATYTLDYE